MEVHSELEDSPQFRQPVDREDAIWELLRKINRKFDGDQVHYNYYLTRLAEKLASRILSSEEYYEEILKSVLTDPPSTEGLDRDEVVKIQFTALFCLAKLHQQLGETKEAIEVIKEHKEQFGDWDLFRYLHAELRSESGQERRVNRALEDVWQIREEDSSPEFEYLVSKIIAVILENGGTYTGSNREIPSQREELLDLAEKASRSALGDHPEYSPYLHVRGRILAQDGNTEAAKNCIREGIENLNRTRESHKGLVRDYQLALSKVEFTEQKQTFEKKSQEVVSQLDSLQDDLETETREFQTRILQFLGFFAGLITVAISTTQVILSVRGFEEAARLTLILNGGILIAFAGFSCVLPWRDRKRMVKRSTIVMLAGLILILGSIFAL
ncbi:tetratricopeptide repeat protein [Halorussus salinus]|uniref:hypothetical protein n=1 Tax=Halorussus salinus TaxID=1364935 RepID=UPI0010921AEF|nr:hypothetical protein [Halorussus salinus]